MTILSQRICLVELENKEDKIRIVKNKNKLRKLTGKMIYIDNDYTVKEQQIQRNIRKGGCGGKAKRKSSEDRISEKGGGWEGMEMEQREIRL